jgi:Holliday junction DNA helicase RuvA
MIEFISGRLVSHDMTGIVVEQAGIGYYISVPTPHIDQFQQKALEKEMVLVYTELIVREDSLSLYGFVSHADRSMFRMLLGVSRVGPQLACSILSSASVDEIATSILQEKEEVLTAVPGIGQKNAKRIILELKDKMKKYYAQNQVQSASSADPTYLDAILALVALGFERQESEIAIREVIRESTTKQAKFEPDVSDLVKGALVLLRGDVL